MLLDDGDTRAVLAATTVLAGDPVPDFAAVGVDSQAAAVALRSLIG